MSRSGNYVLTQTGKRHKMVPFESKQYYRSREHTMSRLAEAMSKDTQRSRWLSGDFFMVFKRKRSCRQRGIVWEILCFKKYIRLYNCFPASHVSSHNSSDFNYIYVQLWVGIRQQTGAFTLEVTKELVFFFLHHTYTNLVLVVSVLLFFIPR